MKLPEYNLKPYSIYSGPYTFAQQLHVLSYTCRMYQHFNMVFTAVAA